MKVVAIMGSYRKGKTIDTLVDKAIDGVKSAKPDAEIEKITLIDRDIQYCRNCGVCRKDDTAKPIARCAIDDDMQQILPIMGEADAYIFGVPIFEGTVNAVTKTFLERICWTMAKAGRWPVKGCPEPRIAVKNSAVASSCLSYACSVTTPPSSSRAQSATRSTPSSSARSMLEVSRRWGWNDILRRLTNWDRSWLASSCGEAK